MMKILVVDDHVVVRQGVRRLIAAAMDASILEASSGYEALSLFRRERPDLTILDLSLEDMSGHELITRLVHEDEKIRIIVFSMHEEPIYVASALSAGARGYVSKCAPASELLTAVERLAEDTSYVERKIGVQLDKARALDDDPFDRLTARDFEIIRLLGEGKSIAGIAAELNVAYKTAANLCGIIRKKLMCSQTTDLIRLANDPAMGLSTLGTASKSGQ